RSPHSFPTRRSSDLGKIRIFVRRHAENLHLNRTAPPPPFPVGNPGVCGRPPLNVPMHRQELVPVIAETVVLDRIVPQYGVHQTRSEEHTSELQSLAY